METIELKLVKLASEKEINRIYAKDCFFNVEPVFAYLDSGSRVNIIHTDTVNWFSPNMEYLNLNLVFFFNNFSSCSIWIIQSGDGFDSPLLQRYVAH